MKMIIVTRMSYDDAELSRERLLYTQKITVPSLLAQSYRQDVIWLCKVNADDPLLEERKAVCLSSGLQVEFVCGDKSIEIGQNSLVGWIDAHLERGERHLQIRLDSDDALAVWYLDKLHATAHKQHVRRGKGNAWYIAPNGMRTDLKRSQFYHHPNNMFPALCCTAGEGRDVYEANHRLVRERAEQLGEPVIEWTQDVAWLWIRHPHTKTEGGRQRMSDRFTSHRLFGLPRGV